MPWHTCESVAQVGGLERAEDALDDEAVEVDLDARVELRFMPPPAAQAPSPQRRSLGRLVRRTRGRTPVSLRPVDGAAGVFCQPCELSLTDDIWARVSIVNAHANLTRRWRRAFKIATVVCHRRKPLGFDGCSELG